MDMTGSRWCLSMLLLAALTGLVACASSEEEPINTTASASADSSTSGSTKTPSVSGRSRGDGAEMPSEAMLASFSVDRVESGGHTRLVLVTHGSSSCPWRAKDVQATTRDTLTITVGSRAGSNDRPCTADDAKRRERLDLPADVRPEQVKTVRLTAANGGSAAVSIPG